MSTVKVEPGTKHNSKRKSQIIFLIVIAVILGICNIVTGGKFLMPGNIKTVLTHSVFYMFVSWGMIFVFTPGIVDLSIGATVILAANFGAICAMDLGMGYAGLIIITIVTAMALEFLTVFCSLQLKIPSWVSGLGMALIYEAILSIYVADRAKTAGTSVITLDDTLRVLGKFPVMMVLLIVGFIVVYFLFNRTGIGFNIVAVGGNKGVAKAMGINVKKTILIGAIIGGCLIGIGGLLQESYVGKFYAQSGLASMTSIFRSLAIMLLSGSLAALFTQPVGVLICSILVLGLFNFLTLMGVPSGTGQEMCLGALVIVCGIISSRKEKGVVK